MTKTARRKMKKAQRKAQQSRPAVQRATSLPRATPLQVADPFDLSPADIQRAAQAQQNAQRRGQQRAPVIGGKPDYSETLHHDSPPRHAPPARDPGRTGPVAPDILYFEAWRAWIKADAAVYKPRHYLGISPVF